MSSPVPPPKPAKPPAKPPKSPAQSYRPPPPAQEDDDPPPPSDDEEDLPPPSDDDEGPPSSEDEARAPIPVKSMGGKPPPPPPPPPPARSPAQAVSIGGPRSPVAPVQPPSASPVRVSLAVGARPPPPPGPPAGPSPGARTSISPKPERPERSPIDSTRSSASSISPIRGTASRLSTMTVMDPDEEIIRAAGLQGVYENAILQNVLSKMNRDGTFEKNIFILTPEDLMYFKMPAIKPNTMAASAVATLKNAPIEIVPNVVPPPPEPSRSMPLSTVLAMPLSDEDQPGKPEKRARAFKILAKQKSFFVRAPSVALKDQWLKAIQDAATAQQLQHNGSVREAAQTAPIYVSNENNCQICQKAFTFFVRKNHCHNCGKCVCEVCSREKVRILKIDDKKLFRVCNPCGKELKSTRVYGIHRFRSPSEDAAEGEATPPPPDTDA